MTTTRLQTRLSGLYESNRDKFRDYKIRYGKRIPIDGLIEKSSYLIDTKGEKKQLSAFRLASRLQNTKAFKQRKSNFRID